MLLERGIRFVTRFSLAVLLTDSVTGEAPTDSSIRVVLKDIPLQPIRKKDDQFIFVDLEAGEYTLEISSTFFMQEQLRIQVQHAEANLNLIQIALMPSPKYPFKEGTIAIRGALFDPIGHPMADQPLLAQIESEPVNRARLADEQLLIKSQKALFANFCGKVLAGEWYCLKSNMEDRREMVQIQSVDAFKKQVIFQSPIHQTFERGSILLPMLRTKTNEKGEFVLVFRSMRQRKFEYSLTYNDAHGEHIKQFFHYAEPDQMNIGKWIIQN